MPNLATNAAACLLVAQLLIGCAGDNSYKQGIPASNSIQLSLVTSDIEWRFPALPNRPSAGQTAVQGAGEATGAVVNEMLNDPAAIILLPIFLPIGLVVGAASAPSDEEWANIKKRYARLEAGQKEIYTTLRKRNFQREFEASLLKHFSVEAEASSKCVSLARQKNRCQGFAPTTNFLINATPRVVANGYEVELTYRITTEKGQSCNQSIKYLRYSDDLSTGLSNPDNELKKIRDMEDAIAELMAFNYLNFWLPKKSDEERDFARAKNLHRKTGFSLTEPIDC